VLIPTRGVVVGCTLFEIGVTIVIGDSVVDNLLGRIVENRVVKNVGKNVVDGKPVVVRKVVVAGWDNGSTVVRCLLVVAVAVVVGGRVVVVGAVVVVGGAVVVVGAAVVVVGAAVVVVVVGCWVVGNEDVAKATGSSRILLERVGVGSVVVTGLLFGSTSRVWTLLRSEIFMMLLKACTVLPFKISVRVGRVAVGAVLDVVVPGVVVTAAAGVLLLLIVVGEVLLSFVLLLVLLIDNGFAWTEGTVLLGVVPVVVVALFTVLNDNGFATRGGIVFWSTVWRFLFSGRLPWSGVTWLLVISGKGGGFSRVSNPLTLITGSIGTKEPFGNFLTIVLLGYTPTIRKGVSLVGNLLGRLRNTVLLFRTAKMK
jgi:hypothetical protein